MQSYLFKWLVNVWPPYYGTGIKVRHISKDYREIIVGMKLRFYNKNYVGAHFGGSLYSMVDPFYMLMLMQILGKDYIVWDKAAKINFVKPGKGTVTAHFKMDKQEIDIIRDKTETGLKYLPVYTINVKDNAGGIVARAEKKMYIKKKREKGSFK